MNKALLSEIVKARPFLLLGMGNPLRGDDAIGHQLAESLEPSNKEGFQAHAVGTSVENAMRWVREAAGGTLLLVDAVFDETLAEGNWAFYPPDRLDSICHSTHSIPLSMLISYWQKEVPLLQVHFLGISIRSSTDMAPLSPALQQTLQILQSFFPK
ncbi:MAG TPA: hydrogenase maturation protease [Acidobacteriota bacterium]|nr:hydrogenase maturation protease [Acidobacteriota bacterium]